MLCPSAHECHVDGAKVARIPRPKKNPGTAALNAATNAKGTGIAVITVGVGKATNPGLLKAVATTRA